MGSPYFLVNKDKCSFIEFSKWDGNCDILIENRDIEFIKNYLTTMSYPYTRDVKSFVSKKDYELWLDNLSKDIHLFLTDIPKNVKPSDIFMRLDEDSFYDFTEKEETILRIAGRNAETLSESAVRSALDDLDYCKLKGCIITYEYILRIHSGLYKYDDDHLAFECERSDK